MFLTLFLAKSYFRRLDAGQAEGVDLHKRCRPGTDTSVNGGRLPAVTRIPQIAELKEGADGD